MGFGSADEKEEKAHHLRCDAVWHGKVCGVCGKELGSAVWRDRIATGHDWSPWHRQNYSIVPVCGECKTRDEWGFGDPWIDDHKPCVGCGRSVYNRWNWKGQYAVCSNACEPAARAKRARDLSAKRREGMTCEQCGKDFTPPRDDAKFARLYSAMPARWALRASYRSAETRRLRFFCSAIFGDAPTKSAGPEM